MDWKTDIALLDRLRDADAAHAWELFYDRYADAIFRYARKLGLNDADARDVVQETMIVLMRLLPDFVYDPSRRFRNLILTIAHRSALRVLQHAARTSPVAEPWILDVAGLQLFEEDPGGELSKEDLSLWRQSLVESTLQEFLRHATINRQSYEVFQCHVVQHQPVLEVAQKFGISVNSVYQTKLRVLKRLKAAVAHLEQELG